jgi:integrase/recombinase XerC
MSQLPKPTTVAEMYDWALYYGRDKRLPPDYPKPRPTSEWPPENIALLEQYCEWLRSGGASPAVIRTIYLPMAGHVLGLALKPPSELDLDADLQRGLDYLQAKQMSAEWTDICRNSMLKFRRFLRHQRGILEIRMRPFQPELHTEGLPTWLIHELTRYQHIQQRNWRQARLHQRIHNFWIEHLRVWRYLCEKRQVVELKDVKRRFLLDFVDLLLEQGYAASTINAVVRYFHGFLGFLQEEGYAVTQTLLRIPCLKQPEPLPKFLTDEQVKKLRDEFEERVLLAKDFRTRREALLDRAAFLLLWQSGLRVGEVEELRLDDLDLKARRLTVRQSKNMKDRTVFMTDTTIQAVQEYLVVRGPGPTEHVFLYRNQPLSKDLIPGRLKSAGDRVGVKVHPHRLRHTAATQLLNAGCRVTSIQKFLGHKEISTTMIYARVHDQTVAEDYYAAMSQIEKRLDLIGEQENLQALSNTVAQNELLELTKKLMELDLGEEERINIAIQIRQIILGTRVEQVVCPSPVTTVIDAGFD